MLSTAFGGRGSPADLTPSSPAIWVSHWNGVPSASRAASVASTISGPIPSPGISVAGIGCCIDIVSLSEGRELGYRNSGVLHCDLYLRKRPIDLKEAPHRNPVSHRGAPPMGGEGRHRPWVMPVCRRRLPIRRRALSCER